jgi:hypothetical protein
VTFGSFSPKRVLRQGASPAEYSFHFIPDGEGAAGALPVAADLGHFNELP